ncbi:YdeI family protein [Mangrovimonas sp. ST2L15]|uniref:YdeI/OmpD-associated family protein n=1 Tax=Mangrovimonas sp. ST2L15 TaxID=1645916 RepID=UPI001E4063D0|nr:YdeI/OmpD-associated family protein [Mangrovimonas sp. ST2L15]
MHLWQNELRHLRTLALECGLIEELKWSVPCYTYKGNNILLINAFRDNCTLSFFKGILLKDPYQILDKPGKNSRIVRLIRLDKQTNFQALRSKIKEYIFEAMEVEEKGLKIELDKAPEQPIPEELDTVFKKDPAFKAAFYKLTPGRQRGYLIYFSAPKQSKTKASRIEKYTSHILNGKGFHDK